MLAWELFQFSCQVCKFFHDSPGRMQPYKDKVETFQVSPSELVTFCCCNANKFEEYFKYKELQPLLLSLEVALLSLVSKMSNKHSDLMPDLHVAYAATATAHHGH